MYWYLTQECLLGVDFLEKYGCVFDMENSVMRTGNHSLYSPLHSESINILPVCSVTCAETTTVPRYHQMEVPTLISGPNENLDSYVGMLEPETTLLQRHGVLVAHSCHTISLPQGTSATRILNPSSTPITLYQNEKKGSYNLHSWHVIVLSCPIAKSKNRVITQQKYYSNLSKKK